ncbi:MAG: hypothetical protein L0027_16740 [Candidatus Rokubacteria bacterium]|nr:hypothetical protein [Candidatus Rokubacteria bacterium]
MPDHIPPAQHALGILAGQALARLETALRERRLPAVEAETRVLGHLTAAYGMSALQTSLGATPGAAEGSPDA